MVFVGTFTAGDLAVRIEGGKRHVASDGSLHVQEPPGIAAIEQAAQQQRVAVVVNYDIFSLLSSLLDEYTAMVRRLTGRYYSRVTRYGTVGFLKARLDGRASSQ